MGPKNSPLETRSGVGGETEGDCSVGRGGAVFKYYSVPGGPPAATQVHQHIPQSLTHSRQPYGVDEGVCEYLCGGEWMCWSMVWMRRVFIFLYIDIS